MVSVGLLIVREAKPGKEDELANFRAGALPLVERSQASWTASTGHRGRGSLGFSAIGCPTRACSTPRSSARTRESRICSGGWSPCSGEGYRFAMAVNLPMYGCSLSQTQLEEQLGRYRRLARHVVQLWRADRELTVEFADRVPDAQIERALEVERECCSFLRISYAPEQRRLVISAPDSDQAIVLSAIAGALASRAY
jgi:hypothetical protein